MSSFRQTLPTPGAHSAHRAALALGLALACTVTAGCGEEFVLEDHLVAAPQHTLPSPEACERRNPLRDALFGDLHVHTSLSSDARNYFVRARPDDAYRYAFGEPIGLPPNDEQDRPTRQVRIDRPLDFAAVTDHAEFLGETLLCADEESEVYETEICLKVRSARTPLDSPFGLQIMLPFPSREDEICGDDRARCKKSIAAAWGETIRAAEAWNDTSSQCARTTFVAYEYSSHRLGSNLHRNVIFRNAIVPKLPISFIDSSREWQLWGLLKQTCKESGTGCDVLAIPHNSNISNGRMFAVDYPGASGEAQQAARARLRVEMEPIVEVMQHKGDSECRPSMAGVLGGEDELCDFEKFEDYAFSRSGSPDPGACYSGPLEDWLPRLGPKCLSPLSYARYALTEGLKEEARIGVNPFKFGLMASTDTHNGLAGGVEERSWPGHLGVADDTIDERVSNDPEVYGNTANGPGGLIGVWAEENSRESIFLAMRRKEVFGTSGPRIRPRLFGAWGDDIDASLCSDPQALARAYERGVPMGDDLPGRSTQTETPPRFLALAHRDPGTPSAPGGLLQRIQIIKGWVDDEGRSHQRVFDVAGGPNDASVDPASCSPRGAGHETLCAVWTDPEFDASRRAVYYSRVVENPSCRYSAWQCLALAESERPAGCSDPERHHVIQERAWTSPIWYAPAR